MFISIDVGGTNTRVVGSRSLGKPVFTTKPLRRKKTHNFLDDLDFIVDSALKIAGDDKIEGVGIGAPGSPNENKTKIKSTKNLSSWAGKPLVESISNRLGGCPVFYDNDVCAAALGESYYGNPAGDFDYIIWGTGVGGATTNWHNNIPAVAKKDWKSEFENWEAEIAGSELPKKFKNSQKTSPMKTGI